MVRCDGENTSTGREKKRRRKRKRKKRGGAGGESSSCCSNHVGTLPCKDIGRSISNMVRHDSTVFKKV